MRYPFICSANKQTTCLPAGRRSKTAEDYFAEKYPEHEILSAGTNLKVCRKEGTTELTEDLLKWADKVVVMEKKHLDLIQHQTGSRYYSKIQVLHIPDIYKYYDRELIEILEQKVRFCS